MPEKERTYKVLVNGFVFFFTDKEMDSLDLVSTSSGDYHLINNHRSVNAALISAPINSKQISLAIDGENFDVTIKDELDQLLDDMGLVTGAGKQVKEIKAPMPGLVLEIAVTNGQQVQQGEKLLILEAMKMENSIIIPVNATIKKVLVAARQAVEKGQVLIELE